MAIEIEVEVTGTGAFAGHKSNVGTYSYDEESSPTSPADSSGGVGELSFDVSEDAEQTILLYKDGIRLTDSFSGAVAGLVDTINVNDGVATIAGRSRLGLLNTTQTVVGGSMTLGTFITSVLNAGSITGGIQIDPEIASRAIIAPTYTGDLWILLKDICTAQQVEVALVDDIVTIRPLRMRTIQPLNLETESWSVADSALAQSIEVAYYNYETVSNSLVYPKGGWNEEVQVFQVDANQTLVVELPVDFYLTSVSQPTIQTSVARNYTGPNSVYSVAGNDGLPIVPAQWMDGGGSLTLALKDNGTVIEATIVGANVPNLAPFRIAVSSGPSDYYSTLRIMGSGVGFTREIYTQPTGLTEEETATVVGITVENPMISTLEEASQAASYALKDYALPRRTYSATARVVNRSSTEGPDVIYPSFEAWADTLPGVYLFSDFNTDNLGVTFQDFTDAQYSTVVNDFENQAFGNVAGSRVRYRDAWYRVRSANSTQDSVSFTAEFDTLFSDFNTENTGTEPGTRANLTDNPSAEVGALASTGSAATTQSSVEFYSGSFSTRVAATASLGGCVRTTTTGVVPNLPYTASVWVKGESGKQVRIDLIERTSGGSTIGTSSEAFTLNGTWQRLNVSRSFGPLAGRFAVQVLNLFAGSHTFYVDALLVEQSDTLYPYFDGNTPDTATDTYSWAGTPNLSFSNKTSTAYTFAEFNDNFAGLTFTDFALIPLRRN